jgi:hypothetical protein
MMWEEFPILCGAWSVLSAQVLFVVGYWLGHRQAKKMCLDTISKFRELVKP